MFGTTRGPKHVIRFVFALMLLLPIAGVQSALASPLSQAGVIPITYGDTLTGSLNAKTPEAQYQFTAAAGDLVSISVVATSGDLDPKVQLLDLSGAVLAENDDIEFPSNTDSLIENYSIPATGDYRIVVMRGLDSTSGGYQVSLMRGGAGDTPPLPTLGTETGTGALRFVLSWSGAADLDLIVTDPAGNQIYWDAPTSPTGGALDSSQGNDFCEVAAAQPQEVIAWMADAPTGDYTVMVQLSLACNTTGEVPLTVTVEGDGGAVLDVLEGAVSEGNPVEGTFTFTGSGGSAVTGQGALRFVLSWSGAADLDLVVTDPAGNQIYWDAPTSPTGGALDSSQGNDFCEVAAAQPQEVIAWEANAPAGDYTVMVQLSLACNTTGEVPLTVTVEGDGGAVLDVLEGTVSDGNPAQGTFTFAGAGAPPIAAEGALNFVLNWSGAADLDLIVTDPAGNQIYWDAPTSPTGGVLDSTLGNDFCEVAAAQPQEVVFWETSAPTGDYGLMVQLSLPCGTAGAVPFTIQVVDAVGAVLDTLSGEVSEGSASEGTFTYVGGGGAAPLPAVDYGPIPTFTDGSEVPVIEPGVHIQDFIDNQNFALSGRVAGNAGDVITVTMTRVDGDLLPLVAILVEEGDVWTSLASDQSTKGEAAVVSLELTEPGWYIISFSRKDVANGTTSGNFDAVVNYQSAQ